MNVHPSQKKKKKKKKKSVWTDPHTHATTLLLGVHLWLPICFFFFWWVTGEMSIL